MYIQARFLEYLNLFSKEFDYSIAFSPYRIQQ